MNNKLCVSLTYAKENLDKVSIAFTVANGGLAENKEVVVFLSSNAVELSQVGYTDNLHEDGFPPLIDLISNFVRGGVDGDEGDLKGKIWICTPCFNKRNLEYDKVIDGAEVIGGARLIDFLSQDTSSICF